MCVVSNVYDHYRPQIQPWTLPDTTIKYPQPSELDELRKLIREFRQAVAAAKTVDALTGQPDCADPEKAALEERVAKLEKALGITE